MLRSTQKFLSLKNCSKAFINHVIVVMTIFYVIQWGTKCESEIYFSHSGPSSPVGFDHDDQVNKQ